MRTAISLSILALSASVSANILPPQAREELIQAAIASFWGKAKTRDGSVVQPDNADERSRLPISNAAANHVISVGELSGIAEWCSLNWQSHFFSLTAAARQQGFSEKQVAFIGFLHGVAQGHLNATMKAKPCAAEQKARIAQMLEQSPVNKAIPQ